MTVLKRTPLFSVYQKYGGKIVDFAGFEMPVQFAGILAEHAAVRTLAGLFDVSHMGEMEVTGTDALAFLQTIVTNDLARIGPGQAQYSPIANKQGGTVDDVLVYCFAKDRFWVVVNAANRDKDREWLLSHKDSYPDVSVVDLTDEIAQLALQGPIAESILARLTDVDLAEISYYSFRDQVQVSGITCLISRTGYTGEDGFEIYVAADKAVDLYDKIMEVGSPLGLQPIGLGARDTLRLESRLPLYGHELKDNISALEAGLGYFVKLDKQDFYGHDVLLAQKESGLQRKIVGFELLHKGIARDGFTVWSAGEQIGYVTSGTLSPTLAKSIGLALIDSRYSQIGTEFDIDIRGKRVSAKVVKTPFYKRSKS